MLRLVLILIFISTMYNSLNAQWETLNEGFGTVFDIDFTSEQTGWLSGRNKLFKTEDGGENWDEIHLPQNIVFYRFFFSDSIAWAYGYSTLDEKNYIYKSDNGGSLWHKSYAIPENYGFENISIVNDSVVFVVGIFTDTNYCAGWVIKTLDGGTNWDEITPVSPINHLYPNKIYFFDVLNGIVIGECDEKIAILRTADGGNSWETQKIEQFTSIDGIQVGKDSTLYFIATKGGDDWRKLFCTTTDTFKTWQIRSSSSYDISSFFVMEDQTIFSVMADSTYFSNVMKSRDGGFTWEFNFALNAGGGEIIFRNNHSAFINNSFGLGRRGGNSNFLWQTDNGGISWILKKFSSTLTDINFIDKNIGYAAGGSYGWHGYTSGMLFITHDGGISWEIVPQFRGFFISQCQFYNNSAGFIIAGGWSTNVFKTTDAGSDWYSVFQDNYDSLGFGFTGAELAFTDDDVGYIVGSYWRDPSNGAGILGSKDGGENWDLVWEYPITEDIYYNLNSVHTIDNTFWAVGESGMIVKSEGIDSFTVINNVTNLPLDDIFFIDKNHGWISGGYFDEDTLNLKLFKTKDGGQTWKDIPHFIYQINDMFFENSLHGWAVGNDTTNTDSWPLGEGIILETFDGGETWIEIVEGLSNSLTGLHFKDGYGWAVGGNGLVLKTKDGVNWIDQKSGKTYANSFSLSQNYPNPFNPVTKIEYQLPKSSRVNLSIYNLLGQKVQTLVSKKQPAGNYKVEWDAAGYSSGVYLYKLKTNNGFSETKKLIILK